MLDRREFLRVLSMMGLSSLLSSSCSARFASPAATLDEGQITVEMVAAAEKMFGIELTDEEREEVLERLPELVEDYQSLRDGRIDDTVMPAMVFNPIPPGMTFSQERTPFRHSEVDVRMPEQIQDVAFYSVLQLAELIRTGQVTSTALTEMYLDRLKRHDRRLKFVVTLTESLALEQASRADAEIRAGNYRGPLHGIPYGIKDLFSVREYPTTWGAEPFQDRIIDRDASVVERLEQAGAVLLAKLATGTMASGDQWFGGSTRNPWDLGVAGGSSAGPGSATAAGCVGFSVGTETNGSMISPCDACGVTGLRPTFGRVSRYGVMTVAWSWDKIAPMCRTVEDCAVVFNAIYGPDGKDNSIIDLPFNWDPDLDIRQLRIGYRTKYFGEELMPTGNLEYTGLVQQESLKVLDFFRDLGIDLLPLDFDINPMSVVGLTMMCENAAAADEMFRSGQGDLIQDSSWPSYWREHRFVPAAEYLQASRYRSLIIQEMNQVFQDIDVYIEITWTSTWLANMTGHPIVVVPCGFVNGRPVSITFVGRLFGEAELLAVAKAFQDGTDYHQRHPDKFIG